MLAGKGPRFLPLPPRQGLQRFAFPVYAWRFYPFYKEMRNYKPHDYDLICQIVPGYESRPLNRHGSEGDTVIGKAYIYDKYIDDAGRHCLKICGWGEDLEGNVLEVVPMEAVLPSRANA